MHLEKAFDNVWRRYNLVKYLSTCNLVGWIDRCFLIVRVLRIQAKTFFASGFKQCAKHEIQWKWRPCCACWLGAIHACLGASISHYTTIRHGSRAWKAFHYILVFISSIGIDLVSHARFQCFLKTCRMDFRLNASFNPAPWISISQPVHPNGQKSHGTLSVGLEPYFDIECAGLPYCRSVILCTK